MRSKEVRVSGFGSQVSGSGSLSPCSVLRVVSFGLRVPGLRFRVAGSGSGFWVLDLGFGVSGSEGGVSGWGRRASPNMF